MGLFYVYLSVLCQILIQRNGIEWLSEYQISKLTRGVATGVFRMLILSSALPSCSKAE